MFESLNLLERIIIFVSLFFSVAAFFNSEKVRNRLNDLEDILQDKKIISPMERINKMLARKKK